jgi:hypothetical protein
MKSKVTHLLELGALAAQRYFIPFALKMIISHIGSWTLRGRAWVNKKWGKHV